MPNKRGVKSRWDTATKAQVRQMIDNGATDLDIARAYSCHRTTILRLRHELASEGTNSQPEPGTLAHLIWQSGIDRERREAAMS